MLPNLVEFAVGVGPPPPRPTTDIVSGLDRLINDRTKQSRILSDRLDQIEPEFFDRLRMYLREQCIKSQEIKTPKLTQQAAIDAAVSYFNESSRGQLILPCGTGKTLTAMWIAEELGGNRFLIMVPSLSLMSQTLREWAANISFRPFRYLCLCSDTSVDLGNDAPVEHLYDMDVPVTTEADSVAQFLGQNQTHPSVLFSTYQSSRVLVEAVQKTGCRFDVAIFDEAHRTTGSNVGLWNLALHDAHIPVSKRIFMTATPRIYAPHISKKAKDNDILLYSMDDTEVYGAPFYEMTFGEAIEKALITDYKVVIICVTDREVRELILQGGRIIADDNIEYDAKAVAKQVAILKAINRYKLRKIFTFHGKVSGAKAFTATNAPVSIKQIAAKIEPSLAELSLFHINGAMPAGTRNGIIKEFKAADTGIMSNARCLNEGVDVPAVDTVAFIDPKKSLTDIVQATGRALRRAEWKDRGYIFIPVVVDEESNPENLIASSDFDTVWEVIQAMLDQDQRLEAIVSQLRTMQGEGKEGSDTYGKLMSEFRDRIEIVNLPKKIEYAQFTESLYTKMIEISAKSWDFWYGLTIRYKEKYGTPNALQNYITPNVDSLGMWQSRQRADYKNDKLSAERIGRLEEIGFVWDLFNEAFEKGYEETVRYKEQFDTPNAPANYITADTFNLGTWQSVQRRNYKQNKIAPERVERLEAIGFVWNPLDEAFEQGFIETVRYKEQKGTPNAPWYYVTSERFKLGSWQSHQRRNYKRDILSSDRIKRLLDIGFAWDLIDEAFEKGYEETVRYKELFGTPNAPQRYNTVEGFKLGLWQSRQRINYKQNKLSPKRIKRLEEIGFDWQKGKK